MRRSGRARLVNFPTAEERADGAPGVDPPPPETLPQQAGNGSQGTKRGRGDSEEGDGSGREYDVDGSYDDQQQHDDDDNYNRSRPQRRRGSEEYVAAGKAEAAKYCGVTFGHQLRAGAILSRSSDHLTTK